ncbi:hypothetical protein K2Z83_12085 [Oscillochloris sp. ZM17-4]|uniref:hypothetical protein n=1 Tax=Oscillochloris sp. ZM17-4 TaxID=2866714 RepID=UPI001C72E1C6|nr:hypothetical protein [Oscillochloris sp. ZM17-4]MBX0328415.1 hypothetical protein [Oscillochloris sp. ZM17-4]
MKRINLLEQPVDMTELLTLIQEGPVVLLAPNGKEYLVAEADDFDQEVEQLRASTAFQAFLDERRAHRRPRRAITDVARDVEAELAAQSSLPPTAP